MKKNIAQVNEAAEFIKNRTEKNPEIALVTGTGLGETAQSLTTVASFEYNEIPHFPVSTVESHLGKLLVGDMHGKRIIAMQGRFHLYEGYSPLEVTFPIRVMQRLGVKILILSNAAGGLNPEFKPGNIMIIKDHINLTGSNPIMGQNEESWGIRFPDMSEAYDKSLAALAEKAGSDAGIDLQKGVYAGLMGPSLETPAEVRFLKTIGTDAVGFSTVQEVITAVHAKMKVLGLSTITNINNPDRPVPATVDEIIQVAHKAVPDLEKIISKVVENV
ncbi:MAG: purine-nucleoside phosphorylase [Thermodesulfobacteriota bacterium]|nr:purine-nucleoside phosphorylase [Thermodesulfobacteriota bacterium]